ncbi:hypothetical protein GQ43DRAFT_440014 [Delitschia confertaspora ATCC 74209]|uniref:EKC/KEOPS complex subunit GON7 n=1 Tax=Delitschia confertaspora ATCC 74209 TaxID=1513339 RepID=A0A9P4JMC9_9PLEO|nr:hypothetical protein GQ43DRAFT_440014 [Delitschia confertaspora ATCC 74209]
MPELRASYESPTSGTPQTLTTPLPSISNNPTTDEHIAYLEALQSSVVDLQTDINTLLTQKMEEDKAKVGASGATVDDDREEETYGEEVVEED